MKKILNKPLVRVPLGMSTIYAAARFAGYALAGHLPTLAVVGVFAVLVGFGMVIYWCMREVPVLLLMLFAVATGLMWLEGKIGPSVRAGAMMLAVWIIAYAIRARRRRKHGLPLAPPESG